MSGMSEQAVKKILAYCDGKFMQGDDIDGLRSMLELLQENSALQDELAQDSGRSHRLPIRSVAQDAAREMHAITIATRDVEAVTGISVAACDSAAGVYRQGLRALAVDTMGAPSSTFKTLWDAAKRGGRPSAARVAADATSPAARRFHNPFAKKAY
jgi:hypothetical protein